MSNLTKLSKIAKNKRTQQGLILSAAAATLVASGGAPAQTNDVTIANTATQGTQLSVDLTALPATVNIANIHYQWLVGGVNVGTDSVNYTPTNNDVGKNISVTVTYKDGAGADASATSNQITSIANLNDVPTGNVTIGTDAREAVQLTADTTGLIDIDGLGALHYQWKVGGIIVGADSSTYTPTAADLGKTISVDVSYNDGYGTDELISSNEISAIVNANANFAPAFDNTSIVTVTMDENQTTVATIAATDKDGDAITYTLTGADANLFDIDANGVIIFRAAPDYETPLDAGGNNIYNITVSATDGTATTNRDVVVTVENVNEVLSVVAGGTANSANLLEGITGDTSNYTIINVTGLVDGVTQTGTDVNIDPTDPAFQSLTAGETKVITIVYDIVDANGTTTQQTATVTITGTNDAPVVAAAIASATTEDAASFTINMLAGATDADAGETATLTIANVTGLTAGITHSGLQISVDPTNAAFQSLSLGQTQTIIIAYEIVDAQGASVAQTANIIITGTNDAPTFEATTQLAIPISENHTSSLATVTATDLDGDSLTYSLTGIDAALFNVDANGVVTFKNVPDYETPQDAGTDNIYNLTVNAADSTTSTSRDVAVTVANTEDVALNLAANYIASGTEFLVNSHPENNQDTPRITTLSNGNLVMSWASYDGQDADTNNTAIKARIFNAAGEPIAAEFQVNFHPQHAQVTPAITALTGGGFTISWSSFDGQDADVDGLAIKARIYDANGTALDEEFLVNTRHDHAQSQAEIAALDDGGFIITWHSDDQQDAGDTSHSAIKMQRFNAIGVKVGNETLVNSQPESYQYDPDIAILSDGSYIITWESQDAQDADTDQFAIKAQKYNSAGVEQGGEFLVNTEYENQQFYPSVIALNNGGFAISWQSTDQQNEDTDGYAIKARIYDATGTATDDEFLVNSRYNGDQDRPVMTALNNGDFVITWRSDDGLDADNLGFAIKAQVYNPNGVKIGGEILINSQHNDDQEEPDITALADGGFAVTWRSRDGQSDDTSGTAIKAQIYKYTTSQDYVDGETYDFNIIAELHPNHQSDILANVTISNVPDEVSFNLGTHNLDGTWTMSQAQLLGLQISINVNYSGTHNFGMSITSQAPDGTQSISHTTIPVLITDINYAPKFTDQTTLAVSIDENQTTVTTLPATDLDNDTLTYTLTGDDQALFNIDANGAISFKTAPDYETPQDTGTDNIYNITVNAADASTTATRNVEVTVNDYGEPILFVDQNYQAFSIEKQVNTHPESDQTWPSIATLKDGGFLITWTSYDAQDVGDMLSDAIKAQRYDAAGQKVGTEFLVNTQPESNQRTPVVTGLNDGGFTIAWTSYDKQSDDTDKSAVKAQRYDSTGLKAGSEVLVNSNPQNWQENPHITALNDGGYLITWDSTDQQDVDQQSTAIKAQRYDANGIRVDGEVQINTHPQSTQEHPSVATLDNGGYVLVWHSNDRQDTDLDSTAVKAQRYTASGVKVGDETLVNNITVNAQYNPTIASLKGGGYAITWSSSDALGDDSEDSAIKARIFDDQGVPQGAEFLVNTRFDNQQQDPTIIGLNDGGFAITWYSRDLQDADTSEYSIKARIYDATGTASQNEFLVNSHHLISQQNPTIAALHDGGFAITWQSRAGGTADNDGDAIMLQIYKADPTLLMSDGIAHDFNITAQLHPNEPTDTLSDITISGVPTEATFNQGLNNLDGTWTLTQAQLSGLKVTFDSGFNGLVNFELTITSSVDGNIVGTANVSQPISVGNIITGTIIGDTETATTGIDFIKLGDGIDLLNLAGNSSEYSFKTVGSDLQITHTASSGSNTDLLHSVETLKFGPSLGTVDVADLHTLSVVSDMTSDEYDVWLATHYEYNI